MKKNILSIFLITLILGYSNSIVWAEPYTETTLYHDESSILDLNADAAILMDATTGEILYEKNSNKKEYPASITKIMTALLAFEYGKMDEMITFSHNAVFGIEPGSSHIALQENEQITIEQAMYALLLRSANESALGIAEQIDSSVEKFAEHMTIRAKELGCKNTNFVNPNGLHNENHYTTAYDMALIAKEVLRFDKFKEMIQTTYYEIPPTNKQKETRYLYAQHQMIKPPSKYVYQGCEGGKTGFTDEAQNTLVTYAKRDNTELIAVVLHCKGAQHYEDTIKLFDYGFSNYKTVALYSIEETAQKIPITTQQNQKSETDFIFAKPIETVYKTVPIDFDFNKVTKKVNSIENLNIPIYKNDVVATITFYYEQKPIQTVDLLAENSVILEQQSIAVSAQNDKKINGIKTNFSNDKTLFFGSVSNLFIFAVFCSVISFFTALIISRLLYQKKQKKHRFIKRKK